MSRNLILLLIGGVFGLTFVSCSTDKQEEVIFPSGDKNATQGIVLTGEESALLSTLHERVASAIRSNPDRDIPKEAMSYFYNIDTLGIITQLRNGVSIDSVVDLKAIDDLFQQGQFVNDAHYTVPDSDFFNKKAVIDTTQNPAERIRLILELQSEYPDLITVLDQDD